MKKLLLIAGFALVLSLVGCGGGGDSNSGTSYAGTYTGTLTITLIAGSLGTLSETSNITIIITPDGTFSVTDDEGGTVTGQLAGDQLIFIEDMNVTEPGLTCSGSATYTATVNGVTVTGTVAGNSIVCNGVSIQVTGTISANIVSAASTSLRATSAAGIGFAKSALKRVNLK